MKNKQFELVVKKFMLNQFLHYGSILGMVGSGLLLFCFALGGGLTITYVKFFGLMLILFLLVYCLWYCLNTYDEKYGLFKSEECPLCKTINDSLRSYMTTTLDLKGISWFGDIKSQKIEENVNIKFCPSCGRSVEDIKNQRYKDEGIW